MNVTGYVLQFSPLQLRLEWQEPYSPPTYPVLNYTVTSTEWGHRQTNERNVIFNLEHEEFSSCKADIEVTATNGIGESRPSSVASISKSEIIASYVNKNCISVRIFDARVDKLSLSSHAVPTEQGFEIDGSFLSQNDITVLELCIQVNITCTECVLSI